MSVRFSRHSVRQRIAEHNRHENGVSRTRFEGGEGFPRVEGSFNAPKRKENSRKREPRLGNRAGERKVTLHVLFRSNVISKTLWFIRHKTVKDVCRAFQYIIEENVVKIYFKKPKKKNINADIVQFTSKSVMYRDMSNAENFTIDRNSLR